MHFNRNRYVSALPLCTETEDKNMCSQSLILANACEV